MDRHWGKLAGDTGAFALQLAFAGDPDEGRGIDPQTGLSWGSFQIWVDGRNLCAHREEGERVESVHWYLLPLLEWFARHWDSLLHEERLPARNAGDIAWESLYETCFPPPAIEENERKASKWEREWQAWWNRHALRAAREGGLFPDIVFRRFRDSVEISWGPVLDGGNPYRFDFADPAGGAVRLPPAAVAGPLHAVLSDAGEYLRSLPGASRRIKKLRESFRSLEDFSKHRETRLMWLAGLGTHASAARNGWRRVERSLAGLPAKARRAALEVSESPLVVNGSCHAALMFGSLEPDVGERDVLALAKAMVALHSPEGDPEAFRLLCRDVPVLRSGRPAWRQGYDLAEDIHRRYDGELEQEGFVDIEVLLSALDVHVGQLGLSDEKVRGVCVAGPRHRPGIFINSRHAANAGLSGRRFTLAHELCHLLFDRRAGNRLAIASGPWAPRDIEQRANAFAAMLLMPVSLVRRTVGDMNTPLASAHGIREVAERLRSGRQSVLDHLKNLGFLDDHDAQRIRDAAPTVQ